MRLFLIKIIIVGWLLSSVSSEMFGSCTDLQHQAYVFPYGTGFMTILKSYLITHNICGTFSPMIQSYMQVIIAVYEIHSFVRIFKISP